MGLDLSILPINPQEIGEISVLITTRIDLDRDYGFFNQISRKPITIPPQMWVEMYGEKGIERTRTDRYGVELTFIYAKELKKLSLPKNVSARNRAIKSFIDALPDDTPIILWWN